MHHDAAKSGWKTGTTSGHLFNYTNGVSVSNFCWPSNYWNFFCTPQKSMIWLNVASVQADARQGDSGAPVFTGNPGTGAPYAALGILVSVTVPLGIGDQDTCTSCSFAFSRWDNIEPRLGLGTLKPNTTIP